MVHGSSIRTGLEGVDWLQHTSSPAELGTSWIFHRNGLMGVGLHQITTNQMLKGQPGGQVQESFRMASPGVVCSWGFYQSAFGTLDVQASNWIRG